RVLGRAAAAPGEEQRHGGEGGEEQAPGRRRQKLRAKGPNDDRRARRAGRGKAGPQQGLAPEHRQHGAAAGEDQGHSRRDDQRRRPPVEQAQLEQDQRQDQRQDRDRPVFRAAGGEEQARQRQRAVQAPGGQAEVEPADEEGELDQ